MIDVQQLSEQDIKGLFVDHYSKFVAFAGKFVAVEIAEDLVQDVFLQLLKKCGTLSISVALESYVYKAIKNKYFDYNRSKDVHGKYLEQVTQLGNDELDYYDPAGHLSLTLNEKEQSLYNAIENLPPKCREIIKSKYLSGKKTLQISKELGISPRTVETHLYKAVKHLKIALQHVSMLFSFL